MIHTLTELRKDHMVFLKFVLTVMVLWVSGLLVGGAAMVRHRGLILNHPLLIAQVVGDQDRSELAIHDYKLNEITKEQQAAFDDQKELHAAVTTLTDRLNVDEAQFKTAGMVFGIIFTIFNAVSTLIIILEYRTKRKGDVRKG